MDRHKDSRESACLAAQEHRINNGMGFTAVMLLKTFATVIFPMLSLPLIHCYSSVSRLSLGLISHTYEIINRRTLTFIQELICTRFSTYHEEQLGFVYATLISLPPSLLHLRYRYHYHYTEITVAPAVTTPVPCGATAPMGALLSVFESNRESRIAFYE